MFSCCYMGDFASFNPVSIGCILALELFSKYKFMTQATKNSSMQIHPPKKKPPQNTYFKHSVLAVCTAFFVYNRNWYSSILQSTEALNRHTCRLKNQIYLLHPILLFCITLKISSWVKHFEILIKSFSSLEIHAHVHSRILLMAYWTQACSYINL